MVLAYPRMHSLRDNRIHHLFELELFRIGVCGGIRSWSDWISYEDNSIAKGEEQELGSRVVRGFEGCDRLPRGGLFRPSFGL